VTNNSRRIASVEAQAGHRLLVVWQDGGKAVIDMVGVVQKLPYFAPLKDEAAFRQVSVIDYGTGVEWANGLDYSADSLEVMASEQATMTAEELQRWKRQMELSLNEMADIFSISVSAVKTYLTGQHQIPIAMQVACIAMRRDRTILYARFRPRVAGRPRKVVAQA
jgi:hypothetical protein